MLYPVLLPVVKLGRFASVPRPLMRTDLFDRTAVRNCEPYGWFSVSMPHALIPRAGVHAPPRAKGRATPFIRIAPWYLSPRRPDKTDDEERLIRPSWLINRITAQGIARRHRDMRAAVVRATSNLGQDTEITYRGGVVWHRQIFTRCLANALDAIDASR